MRIHVAVELVVRDTESGAALELARHAINQIAGAARALGPAFEVSAADSSIEILGNLREFAS